MPRITNLDVQGLPDFLTSHNFELRLGTIPGANAGRDITIKCLSSVIPGFSNEAVESQLHGHQRKQRGRRIQPQILPVVFIEDQNLGTLTVMRQWHEFVVGTRNGASGGLKEDYSVIAEQIKYGDTSDQIVDQTTLFGLFPETIEDTPIGGEGTSIIQVTVNFSYDYTEAAGIIYS